LEARRIFAALVIQASQHRANAKTRDEVVSELESHGVPKDAAESIVSSADEINDAKKANARGDARLLMLVGIGAVAVGIAISFLTYEVAAPGGRYVIMGGAVLGGGWIFLKGLWRSMD
jgi:hypothetical protein